MDYILRYIFLFLDSIVYSLIGKAYELFMDIAATNIFADGTITKFANRVYALLAIFMLFRLSFSILTYIVNPESASDKSTGGGKLIGNVLITIILLISVPWGFKQVINVQNAILKDNIIGKIILGVGFDASSNTSSTTTNTSNITNQLAPGDEMAWTVFTAFFYPTNEKCEDSIMTLEVSDECKNALNGRDSEGKVGETYSRITKSRMVSAVIDSGLGIARDKDTDEYIFEYTPLISTLVGGFVAYILILFCIQIAVRSVKLGVLELIAPIPVISYLDPKQGKDGMFKKWLKVCGKTFADLFIRLAAIYFAIFIISEIKWSGIKNTLTGQQGNFLIKVLIILGALMFAKDLPKFIEEITGIKLDGGFSLNPMKTLGAIPLVGGGLAAGAALGAGMAKTGFWGAGQLLKAGAQSGAGMLFGKDNWKNAGQSTFRGIREGGISRMQATGSEASGRFKASGVMGTDKYSGDTRSSIIGKQKQELKDAAKKGKVEIAQKNRQWDYGQMLARQAHGNLSSVFGSNEYRESYDNVERLKTAMYDAKAEMTRIENAGASAFESEEAYTEAIKTAQANFGSAEKKYNAAKTTHESLGKIHRSDAEKEAAISFFKDSGGNVNDGTGGARPSPKR